MRLGQNDATLPLFLLVVLWRLVFLVDGVALALDAANVLHGLPTGRHTRQAVIHIMRFVLGKVGPGRLLAFAHFLRVHGRGAGALDGVQALLHVIQHGVGGHGLGHQTPTDAAAPPSWPVSWPASSWSQALLARVLLLDLTRQPGQLGRRKLAQLGLAEAGFRLLSRPLASKFTAKKSLLRYTPRRQLMFPYHSSLRSKPTPTTPPKRA